MALSFRSLAFSLGLPLLAVVVLLSGCGTSTDGGAASAASSASSASRQPVPTPSPTASRPAPDVEPIAHPTYPLRTDGNRIVDAKGKPVMWEGVNWFGFETENQVPHGLWVRDWRDMMAQMVELGFNTIRVPFSLQMLTGTDTFGVVYQDGMNTDLYGKTPLEIMDMVIAEADRLGLMVILDNHSQANDGYLYDLWFGQAGYTEDDWVAAWEFLADRYRDQGNVVAFDLKNEPHGVATWGDGSETDWRRAAERAGNAALAVAPDKLIVVEGIESPIEGGRLESHWWGANLEGVRDNPVRLDVPNRLVYSIHEYGPEIYDHWWYSDPNREQILAQRWYDGFGYVHEEGIAPVLVGEFGAISHDPATSSGQWMAQFTDYLGDRGMHWTYWSWNPDSGDTGGVLADDWTTPHPEKMAVLTRLMNATPATKPAVLTARLRTTSTWDGGACYQLDVTNTSGHAAAAWRATFTLPRGGVITKSWDGRARVDGRTVTVTPDPGFEVIEEGGVDDRFGFCMDGDRDPSSVAASVTAR